MMTKRTGEEGQWQIVAVLCLGIRNTAPHVVVGQEEAQITPENRLLDRVDPLLTVGTLHIPLLGLVRGRLLRPGSGLLFGVSISTHLYFILSILAEA